jgi:hypothetical protein
MTVGSLNAVQQPFGKDLRISAIAVVKQIYLDGPNLRHLLFQL